MPPSATQSSPVERLSKEKAQLQERLTTLDQKIGKLQRAYDLETRPDEKMRLAAILGDDKKERTEVTEGLDRIEGDRLAREALECERRQSYDEAISRWQQVAALGTKRWDASAQLERLHGRKEQADRCAALMKRLMGRLPDIMPILGEVLGALRAPEADPAVSALCEAFLGGQVDATIFRAAWTQIPRAAAEIDFRALYRRLQHGEIALFLGAELARSFDDRVLSTRSVAAELAREVRLESPPEALSAVAEYYQMRPEQGDRALARSLYPRLPGFGSPNPLYELLVGIEEPLLIISAGYDALLERAFAEAKKRHAVISAVIQPRDGFHPGQLLLRRSDREGSEVPLVGDALSKESLLESGYSVVFKIRGTCPAPEQKDPRELCSLVLSERSHFAFARHVDKLLPSYLGAQLATRGFWFLGFSPRQWEDRLFAGAILDSRRSQEPANVVRETMDSFEEAYWESRGVRRHAFDLPGFVRRLREGAT